MSRRPSRRGLVVGLGATLLAPSAALSRAAGLPEIEARHGGRLGVFALDTGSGRALAHRADERFLMCSTFKALLAAAILARIDAGHEEPTRAIAYTQADMIFTSPVTKAHLAEGRMRVADLCRAIVEVSDNTAAVLLMRRLGGPAALTQFVRGLGDSETRSDRYEPASNEPDGEHDTTMPRAMARSLRAILLGEVLRSRSRDRLEAWMRAATPGLQRLRAAFPTDWPAGDRPGTSLDRQTNDCAIVRPPGRSPLIVACYYDAPRLGVAEREAVLREVGASVVRWVG